MNVGRKTTSFTSAVSGIFLSLSVTGLLLFTSALYTASAELLGQPPAYLAQQAAQTALDVALTNTLANQYTVDNYYGAQLVAVATPNPRPGEPKPSQLRDNSLHLSANPTGQEINIQVNEHPNTKHASLLINNQEVMKFRSAAEGLSPFLRAKRAAYNLYVFLQNQGDARLIMPKVEGNKVVVKLGSKVLAHADTDTAIQSKNDTQTLALTWANLTRKALGANPILMGAATLSKVITNKDAFIDPSLFKPTGKTQTGIASWYGPGFHGKRTASGDRFDQYALTAAHPSLPFGTLVRVTSLKTKKATVVRINDRGPYSHGRIIDLSWGASKALGMMSCGPVKLEVLSKDEKIQLREPSFKELELATLQQLGQPAQAKAETVKPIAQTAVKADVPNAQPKVKKLVEQVKQSPDEVILAPAVEEIKRIERQIEQQSAPPEPDELLEPGDTM